ALPISAAEPVLVRAGGFSEPERLTDLRAVVLDRAAGPGVLGEPRRIDLDLLGEVVDRRLGRLAGAAGGGGVQLEELQEHPHPRPRRPRLFPPHRPWVVDQRPARDQSLEPPPPPHPAPPSP